MSVVFVQFMKSGRSGETAVFKKLSNVRYYCPGDHPFIMSKGPQSVHFDHARKALEYALEATESETQIIICDEILDTVLFKTLKKEQILCLMEKCKGRIELVMTGREAPPEVIASADYATQLIQVKHPYYTGVRARKGIEF
jgi:cob(I)alamin adenosyltransferase